MKKLLLLALVSLASFAVLSCDDGSSKDDLAQFRLYVSSGGGTRYLTFGTYSGNVFDPKASWVSSSNGNFSGYTSIEAGAYHIITDENSDHNSARVYTKPLTIVSGKKYTVFLDRNGDLDDISHD